MTFKQSAITQTINGLTAGNSYAVSFYWAEAQQEGFSGQTYSGWSVTLGGSAAQVTGDPTIPSHGFSGWNTETFVFTADSSSDVLSFLAYGGPAGVPPFALLDGVTMNAVPEPSTVVLMGVGIIGIVADKLRRAPGPPQPD